MGIERMRRIGSRLATAIAVVTAATVAGGCLGKPDLEDRWTRIDVVSSNVTPNQAISVGAMVPINLTAEFYYRSIVTGYAVTELRASTSLLPTSVVISPDAPRLRMAQDIDRVLAGSVSMGRSIRPITGWDHLIQRIDFAFNAAVTAAPDSTGMPASSVFLVCYIGSGIKIELPSGADSIAITPLPSMNYELLPVGMPLAVGP